MKDKKDLLIVRVLVLVMCTVGIVQGAMGTAFTYQGQLIDANKPANDQYDFEFKLYDAPVNGNQLATTLDMNELNVVDGYFTAELDFGNNVFDGNDCWLEIGIRQGELNDPNGYTTLSPRTELTPTPYAVYAAMVAPTAGVVPIGSVVSWLKSFPNTPALPDNFAECNGQVLNDSNSPFNGQTIPNLNGEHRFLRGSTTSGATGGSESHNHGIPLSGSWGASSGANLPFDQHYTYSTSTLPSYYEVVWIMRVK